MKDNEPELILGSSRGKRWFRGRNFEVDESSKWAPNKVYQTSDNHPIIAPDYKNGPYWYRNMSFTQLWVPRGELYEKMKNRIEFPKLSLL